jgi:hypothetical protein
MALNFEIMSTRNGESSNYNDISESLLHNEKKEERDEKAFTIMDTFTRCEQNKLGQSWLGMALYVLTICTLFITGYNIYGQLDIPQTNLSTVDIFGDICAIGFLSFATITLPWHSFEKHTCLYKSRQQFLCALARYVLFVIGAVGATVIYGTMRNIPLFQKSLNDDLSHDQYNVYVIVMIVIGCIIIYWFIKLCNCHRKYTKKCCMPEIRNKIAFTRLFLIMSIVATGSYVACSIDECDYHPHHWFFGYSLVILSTTMLDNWFDFLLHGIFWMFVLESQWNGRPVFDSFFI